MKMERLLSPIIGTALVLAATTASAQQPPAAAPPPPPPYGTAISLEQAKKVMAGAEAEAKKNSWNVCIVVLDSGGNVVMLQRMDGAQFLEMRLQRRSLRRAGLVEDRREELLRHRRARLDARQVAVVQHALVRHVLIDDRHTLVVYGDDERVAKLAQRNHGTN